MYIGLHVKYRYSCQALMTLEFTGRIFEKCSNVKFHENSLGGSRDVPCGQTGGWTERRTDMTKPVIAFRNFANAPIKTEINANKLAKRALN